MGRNYAGVLGMIAFSAVIASGLIHGESLERTMGTGLSFLILFSALGWIAGQIAQATATQSALARVRAEESIADAGEHSVPIGIAKGRA